MIYWTTLKLEFTKKKNLLSTKDSRLKVKKGKKILIIHKFNRRILGKYKPQIKNKRLVAIGELAKTSAYIFQKMNSNNQQIFTSDQEPTLKPQ